MKKVKTIHNSIIRYNVCKHFLILSSKFLSACMYTEISPTDNFLI